MMCRVIVHRLTLVVLATALAGVVHIARAADLTSPPLKSERFDHDPDWEGFNNRNAPKHSRTVKQYFGYSATHFAGKDPAWIGAGNRVTFEDHELVGAHDYDYSSKTSLAGGAPGEVGGMLWRGLPFSCYADRVGPLNLEQRLEAGGKVKLVTAGP